MIRVSVRIGGFRKIGTFLVWDLDYAKYGKQDPEFTPEEGVFPPNQGRPKQNRACRYVNVGKIGQYRLLGTKLAGKQ